MDAGRACKLGITVNNSAAVVAVETRETEEREGMAEVYATMESAFAGGE